MATAKYRAPRGTADIMGTKAAALHHMDRLAAQVFGRYGYDRIVTPTFEETGLFTRSIGESSDIVRKEMYTFEDRGGRSLTLRPEATAPVVRAFIEHNMHGHTLPKKLFYVGPMYRYERPQAGRYREFWQIGVEALGSPEPSMDAENIIMLMAYLEALGLKELNLHVGSMGCADCRPGYREVLVNHLKPKEEALCDDCRVRLQTNPLRVFDCKNKSCISILADAPKIIDYLCEACRRHLDSVTGLVEAVGLTFRLDPTLVRGFDYYTRTTFEVRSFSLGAQNALGGGGRYDELVEQYGGQPTPAVGFALGVERVMLAGEIEAQVAEHGAIDLFIASVTPEERDYVTMLAVRLRSEGLAVEVDHMARSLRSQMKLADKLGCRHVLVIGPDEMDASQGRLRDMATKAEEVVAFDDIRQVIAKSEER